MFYYLLQDVASDSCNPLPLAKEEPLPEGCSYSDGGVKKYIADVGQCPNSKCISNVLVDNGTCEESWPSHCCGVSEVQTIEIECSGGFTYPITKVISCKCQEHILMTIIKGMVYGIKNGTRIPFTRGNVLIDGEIKAVTNAAGFFSITLLEEKTRVVLNIENDRSGQLLDATKVINVAQGATTSVDIHVPLKPEPKVFNTRIGFDIPLGDKNGRDSITSLSIPEDSIVDGNGNLYEGTANARVHFVDPRSLEDLDEMYGELSFIDEEGNSHDLETFGMFQMSAEDNTGSPLYINGKIKVSLDTTAFNSSNSADPNIHLYSMDVNTGKWVDKGLMSPNTTNGSNRRRRSANGNIEGVISDDIPIIDQTQIVNNVLTVRNTRLISYRVGNLDRPVQYRTIAEYRQVVSRDVVTRDDACFVRVKAYTDLTFRNIDSGVRITAVTKTKGNGPYRGKMTLTTNINRNNGIVCLPIFCESEVFLIAEKSGKYFAADNHILPQEVVSSNIANGTQVKFNSDYVNRNGPLFLYQRRRRCEDNTFSEFVFQFAPLHKEGERFALDNDYNKINSWYTEPPDSVFRRTCFLKIKVMVSF